MPAAPANPVEKSAHRGVHGAWGKGSACVCCLAPLWCNWGHKRLAGNFPETSKKLPQRQPAPPAMGWGWAAAPAPAPMAHKWCSAPLQGLQAATGARAGLGWLARSQPPQQGHTGCVWGGGGGPEWPLGRPGVGPLCHSPPWPPLARPRATGGKGRGLGWPWGYVFRLNSD